MKLNTFMDFCSGIGGGRLGLEKVGLQCVGYSDTAKLAPITYSLMFDTLKEKNYGNLKTIKTENLPKFDMLIAGFPCQTFSVIGRKDGFSDNRGQIIFHLARILKETQPKCFLLENVKGLVTHDRGKTLEVILQRLNDSGYDVTYKVLTSLDYGVPQMRQRVYFVGIHKNLNKSISEFNWPEKQEILPLSSYLIDDCIATDARLEILQYYLNNPANNGKYTIEDLLKMEGKILDTRMNDLRIYEGKCPTLRAQRDGVLYVRDGVIHQLTGYEALLLQGFPKEYALKVKDKVSDRHLLMQAGNAMTVNVITEIGKSVIEFFDDIDVLSTSQFKGDDNMATKLGPGEEFERRCLEYLRRIYSKKGVSFEGEGGMDSTTSDIAVVKNDAVDFYIEAKDSPAQSGQFVLLPDEESKTFVFSPRNKSKKNDLTDIMIRYMNQHFDQYKDAGTSGKEIDIEPNVFAEWIIEHYRDKNVKYFISHDENYVIFPIRKFAEYFDILASFRVKKSGSGHPAKKDIAVLESIIKDMYPTALFKYDGKNMYVILEEPLTQKRFEYGDYEYYFSDVNQPADQYNITKLSNTRNKNVIFRIELKKRQDSDDLDEFEADL